MNYKPGMPVEIRVDYRESSLLSHLKTQHEGITITEDNLELGDVQIIDQDNNIDLIFERKTLSDLSASLKDGRYKEQKCRILGHYNPKHVTYIIEGGCPLAADKHGLTSAVYEGIYINTMYRDGIHVLFVANVGETAKWITQVATKVLQNPAKFHNDSTPKDYITSCKVKSKKCENVTPETCYIMQLCQVPGVSIKVAKTIQDRYKTLRELVSALSTAQDPCVLLSQLPLIGAKKAKTIVSFLLA